MKNLDLQYGNDSHHDLIAEIKELALGMISSEHREMIKNALSIHAEIGDRSPTFSQTHSLRTIHSNLFDSLFGADFDMAA